MKRAAGFFIAFSVASTLFGAAGAGTVEGVAQAEEGGPTRPGVAPRDGAKIATVSIKGSTTAPVSAASACAVGMAEVQGDFCPYVEQKCLRWLDPETIGTPLVPAERKPLRVGAVSGCFLLVAAEVWRELGGFDERYFLYGEDLDLATRATAAGYTPAVDLAVTFRHRVGGSARSTATRRTAVLTGRVTWYLTTWSPAKARFAVLIMDRNMVARPP